MNASRHTWLVLVLFLAHSIALCSERRAIVIGVSNYETYPEAERLKYAHLDAMAFANLMRGERAGKAKVTLLSDDEATREAIWNAVSDARSAVPQIDELFVFFSGHAELDPETNQLYLMPFDGDRNKLDLTAIPITQLIDRLKSLGTKHLIIFLDACHSGAALLGKGGNPANSLSVQLTSLLAHQNEPVSGGITIFASSSAGQQSWEDDEFKRGVFTRYLVRGLKGEADGLDGASNGYVTVRELKSFLDIEIPKRISNLRKPAQTVFVNSDFNDEFILTTVPTLKPSSPSKIEREISLDQIFSIREKNPQFALMLEIGALKAGFAAEGMTEDLRLSMIAKRVRRRPALRLPFRADTVGGSMISTDGSLFLACVSPSSLLVFSTESGALLKTLRLELPKRGSATFAVMDACNISVSRDNRFAAITVIGDNSVMRPSLLALGEDPQPSLALETYRQATFVDRFLILATNESLKVVTSGIWNDDVPVDPREVRRLDLIASEADSKTFNVSSNVGICTYRFEEIKLFFQQASCTSNPPGGPLWQSWMPTEEGFLSVASCSQSLCRAFPSGAFFNRGWKYILQEPREPNTIRLARGSIAASNQATPFLTFPEPIFDARLFADGRIVAVGREGSVFALNSLQYGDCCSIPVSDIQGITHLAAGNAGMTAVAISSSTVGVEIFQDNSLITKVPTSLEQPVRQIVWSAGNGSVAIANEKKVQVIRSSGGNFRKSTITDFDCGAPIALDATGSKLACVDYDSGRVQYRDVGTGRVDR
jgi:hypothetical protein